MLYGGEANFGSIRGDSVLVPNKVAQVYSQSGINRINFFNIGPGVGYAYAIVMVKYFFVTGSAIANLDISLSAEEKATGKGKATEITPDFVYKGAFGYNSDTWSISASITGNALYVSGKSSNKQYFLATGNMRLVLSKKIGSRK